MRLKSIIFNSLLKINTRQVKKYPCSWKTFFDDSKWTFLQYVIHNIFVIYNTVKKCTHRLFKLHFFEEKYIIIPSSEVADIINTYVPRIILGDIFFWQYLARRNTLARNQISFKHCDIYNIIIGKSIFIFEVLISTENY